MIGDQARKKKAFSEEPKIPMNNHLTEHFKEYIKEKYTIKTPALLDNPDVMQMLYALDWYEIPKTKHADLVTFHPNLTEEDFEEIEHLTRQHRIENGICYVLYAMVGNRLLSQYFTKMRQSKLLRLPSVLVGAAALTYGTNKVLFQHLMFTEIEEKGLDDYYELDLNEQMMRKDI